MRNRTPEKHRIPLAPTVTDPEKGLSRAQVADRVEKGWAAGSPKAAGRTELEIFLHHTFTFFNLVFVVLGLLLLLGGSSVKNMGFLMVAAWNTAIGILQEIRAKRAVDALTLVAARPVRVIRDGALQSIRQEQLVRDDIIELRSGDQIPADGILRTGEMQVDESLVTGESDAITKAFGDELRSGSFALSGSGRAQLTAVGADAFATRLAMEAKANPRASKSGMMRALDRLIFVLGIALIPVGGLLFWQEFFVLELGLLQSVEGTVAALVGMIPEGLYLLTSIAMAASALKLSRDKVLVQDMNCIESLARVDVLCVDKTGTITEPSMQVAELLPLDGTGHDYLEAVLAAIYSGTQPENDTARAMAELYAGNTDWVCTRRIPFTSAAKWSAAVFEGHGTFLVGAPEFILGKRIGEYRSRIDACSGGGYRVLLIARYSGDPHAGTLDAEKLTPLALCLLTSPIRSEAKDTFRYFREQGVSIRVISGDDPRTASRIAVAAGIEDAERYLDASKLETEEDYLSAVDEYTVFGRVTPDQKKRLIAALQRRGHTVAMTGDGVNDLLAMKQADCSVAMASGAQAASQVASLVLLNSDFSGMPGIVAEGRRVINNIQRAAALFLVKNIFSLGLALSALVTGWVYPFIPLHLTVIGALTIGIPSFFLALEPNYDRVEGSFLKNVLLRALPGGLTDLLAILAAQLAASLAGLSAGDTSTICAAAVAVTGLMVLLKVCNPFHTFRKLLWGSMAVGLMGCFTVLRGFFQLEITSPEGFWLLLGILLLTPALFLGISKLLTKPLHTAAPPIAR